MNTAKETFLIKAGFLPPNAQMLNQVLNLTSHFFNREQVGDQADGKLLLHIMSFRAALFSIDCVLGRGIKIDPTALRYSYYSQTIHLRREYGGLGCAMFSAKRFGLRHVDTKRFGACAGWYKHIESCCIWFGQLALRGI